MARPIINIDWPVSISKGDTIILSCTADQDITDWKIRCEFYDNCTNIIKLATANSGGSISEIEVTDASKGKFTIKVGKNETTNFDKKSFIEIEIEDDSNQLFTVYEAQFRFKTEQITWTDPTA